MLTYQNRFTLKWTWQQDKACKAVTQQTPRLFQQCLLAKWDQREAVWLQWTAPRLVKNQKAYKQTSYQVASMVVEVWCLVSCYSTWTHCIKWVFHGLTWMLSSSTILCDVISDSQSLANTRSCRRQIFHHFAFTKDFKPQWSKAISTKYFFHNNIPITSHRKQILHIHVAKGYRIMGCTYFTQPASEFVLVKYDMVSASHVIQFRFYLRTKWLLLSYLLLYPGTLCVLDSSMNVQYLSAADRSHLRVVVWKNLYSSVLSTPPSFSHPLLPLPLLPRCFKNSQTSKAHPPILVN